MLYVRPRSGLSCHQSNTPCKWSAVTTAEAKLVQAEQDSSVATTAATVLCFRSTGTPLLHEFRAREGYSPVFEITVSFEVVRRQLHR